MADHIPRKRFGQNFLHDARIIHQLVAAIKPKPGDNMVEIGPGQGALTRPLLQRLDTLHVIELDRDLLPALQAMSDQGLVVHAADALRFDFATLTGDRPLRIVGNLPYNISTPLLFHLLQYRERIADMHFMLQLEVVNRLAAAPGGKDYGKLSVITQYFCQVDKLFQVPPGAFNPPPKVMSAIVRLSPRPFATRASDQALFEQLVRIAFSQRRKTLRNNLKQLLDSSQLEQLQQQGFDLSLRPEQLAVADFVALANAVTVRPAADA
ncbi:MAG TPA: 16S rRNA (adenine(1518)-N(6)/adenine(1519)-N(6))-dimethyltransferase RsmA [Pseudomonadales bacterium]